MHDLEAEVYVVTGEDYAGITFEATSVEHALERAKAIVPDLMEANGDDATDVTVTVTGF